MREGRAGTEAPEGLSSPVAPTATMQAPQEEPLTPTQPEGPLQSQMPKPDKTEAQEASVRITVAPGNKLTSQSLLLIFLETYRSDETIVPRYSPSELAYLAQPLVILTLFLGLPNHKRTSDALTVYDVLKNMINWDIEDEKKGKFSVLDKILAIPMFLYHLIRMIISTIFNIAKIFTEFLPGIAEESCLIALKNLEKKSSPLQYYAAKIGYGFFGVLHFIGRAATSPIKGMISEMDQQRKDRMYLSIITSGVIYGVAGTAILGVTLPVLAALPIGILAYKLVVIGAGLITVSCMGVACFACIQLLLKSMGDKFSRRQTETASPTLITSTTSTMLHVMPPNVNGTAMSSTDEHSNEVGQHNAQDNAQTSSAGAAPDSSLPLNTAPPTYSLA